MIHAGGCHCKLVRFTVDMNVESGLTCNCSICSMKAHVLGFAPETNFKLLSGQTYLSTYQFGKKAIQHIFCKNCGISSFGKATMPDGTKMVSINLNCLDDFDKSKLPIKQYNGKDL